MFFRNALLACSFVVGLASTPVGASVMVVVGPPGVTTNENLQFNDPGLTATGTTVTGATNQTLAVLDIVSFGTTLTTPSAGQARFQDVNFDSNGTLFNGASLIPHSGSTPAGLNPMTNFTSIEFNVKAGADGTLNLKVFLNGGATETLNANYSLDGSGENVFGIAASGTDVITKVILTTPTDNIEDVRQIRLGGVNTVITGTTTATTTATATDTATDVSTATNILTRTATATNVLTATGGVVPEPTTLALWGLLGGGMALFGRRRKLARAAPRGVEAGRRND